MPRHLPELDGKTFLVCIGAAKCGTSWLHRYLSGLPEVEPSPLKELHFFNSRTPVPAFGDPDAVALARLRAFMGQPGDTLANLRDQPAFAASLDRARMIYDEDAYFGHFARLVSPHTRVLADITPAYATLGPAGFADMRAFFASQQVTLKVLFIMRDPVDRLWSQLRHVEQMTPDKPAATHWHLAPDAPAIWSRTDYRATIAALDACFAPEDRLCLFYETLFAPKTLGRLCGFLGVEAAADMPAGRQNETQVQVALPDDARRTFADLLAPQYAFCRERFGTEVPEAWGRYS